MSTHHQNPQTPLKHHQGLFSSITTNILWAMNTPQTFATPDQPRCEWDFSLSAAVSPTATEFSDAVGAIEFDPSDRLLATAGLARKIRLYSLSSLTPANNASPIITNHSNVCEFYICAPAKLSSLRWRPDHGGRTLASGDYDGVVTEYDVETRTPVFERDEHGGRRVWSVDYSHWAPAVGASGSDDSTAQLWDTRCGGGGGGAAATVTAAAAVCCVEFDPRGGSAIGIGCADRRGYIYDVRAMAAGAVTVLEGHRRTVTYMRFVAGERLVTSATDGSHKMWELAGGAEVREYRGHVNERRFVGMSAWREGGLIGCGSESNEVYVYDLRWGAPIWAAEFAGEEEGGARGFVGAVGWRDGGGEEGTLVAGGSNGVLKVFAGKRREKGDW